MKEDFHVDMCGKIKKMEKIGIACVGAISKKHNGCALKANLIEKIKKNLYSEEPHSGQSQIYAICIFLLIKDKLNEIKTLIICNDEKFELVKKYLVSLIGRMPPFQMISISNLRAKTGIKDSLADNLAYSYRQRALKFHRQNRGKKLEVVEIGYDLIEKHWKNEVSGNRRPNQSSA